MKKVLHLAAFPPLILVSFFAAVLDALLGIGRE
jgi:hypothetical protein